MWRHSQGEADFVMGIIGWQRENTYTYIYIYIRKNGLKADRQAWGGGDYRSHFASFLRRCHFDSSSISFWFHFSSSSHLDLPPIQVRVYFDFSSISLWCHFDYTLVSQRSHCASTSVSCRLHFGLTSVSFRSHIDLTSFPHRFHLGLPSVSLRIHVSLTPISLRFHIDVTSISLRVSLRIHCGLTSVSDRFHLAFTSIPLWPAFKPLQNTRKTQTSGTPATGGAEVPRKQMESQNPWKIKEHLWIT